MSTMFAGDTNKISMMRIGVFVCICLGVITTLTGLVGFIFNMDSAILVIGSGEGLIGVALGCKAFQKQSEGRIECQRNFGNTPSGQ